MTGFYKSLYGDAAKLAALIEKLRGANQWTPDLSLLMANAATALRDFVEANPLKSHIEKLEAELRRERSASDMGMVDASVQAALETRRDRARGVLQALQG